MFSRFNQQDKLRTTVNISRLARLPLQTSAAALYFYAVLSQQRIIYAVLVIVSAAYFTFYLFCSLTRQYHLLNSHATSIPDMLITGALMLFISPFLMLPFVYILTAELVLEKQHRNVIIIFTVLTSAAMIFQLIYGGRFLFLAFLLPAVCAQIGVAIILYIQNSTNKTKYEYMKKLVDNKNKLLSTLTHELRTPLSVIKTSNELIMEERPGPINDTQKALIHSSIENTKRLNALVENILSQVKVEFAWFSMKHQPIDIRNIIRKTVLDIKPYLDTRGQKLKYNYPSLMSKTIGDRKWLEQVLLNLIHNGSKNSPEGSELLISVQENEQCIVVSVHDRGSGIENREIPHVFNEFYQSTDPSKNLNDGAGLGLTIVKDIIERHKGEVYISSMPNAGTTVSFTLPLYKGVFSGTVNPDN